MEFSFRTDRHVIKFVEDERGRVDYRELDLIENVKAEAFSISSNLGFGFKG